MGDIGFEEQLEQERLERESQAHQGEQPHTRVDPDGTTYTWDPQAKAWFPKIDSDFIAQYQMNYGVSEDGQDQDKQAENYKQFYESYYEASVKQEEILARQPKSAVAGEESHEESVHKLATLEQHMAGDTATQSETEGAQYQTDSGEEMAKYTEAEKKQYNDYWSYYYGTDYHDYYADCMAQWLASSAGTAGDQAGVKQDDKAASKGKKRKAPQQKREEGWFDVSEEHNTTVYVSGLPLDITEEEFKDLMSKYGLIMNDPRGKKPKLKLYLDENSQPKGDGRCCFIKRESVDLILNLLDGGEYRGHKVKVELAAFTLKGQYDPSKKKKKLTNKEKRKLKERQAKLFDWRPDKPRGARMKHEKVVVLKNVFDHKEFEDDPVRMNVLRDKIKAECSKYGDVNKAVVYDRHEDGVVLVHFAEAEQADMCVEYMNQRFLGNRRILAATWDGAAKYDVAETEAEREARLKKWVEFLEEDNASSSKTQTTAAGPSASLPVGERTSTVPGQGSKPPAGENTSQESTPPAGENTSQESTPPAGENTSQGSTPPAGENMSQGSTPPAGENMSQGSTSGAGENTSQGSTSPAGETTSPESTASQAANNDSLPSSSTQTSNIVPAHGSNGVSLLGSTCSDTKCEDSSGNSDVPDAVSSQSTDATEQAVAQQEN